MKKLKLQIRMYIAELLLGWAFDIATEDGEGEQLRIAVAEYFITAGNKMLLLKREDAPLKRKTITL